MAKCSLVNLGEGNMCVHCIILSTDLFWIFKKKKKKTRETREVYLREIVIGIWNKNKMEDDTHAYNLGATPRRTKAQDSG